MVAVETALVVGCGSIGTRHARNLLRLGLEVSLYDIDADRRDSLGKELQIDTQTTLKDGLDENPDIVVIATPNNHHLKPARAAVAAGCSLFVEKPLSHNANGVEELVNKIQSNNLVSMIGCNLRFHPAINQIKELLNENKIGNTISARIEGGSYLPDWHPDENYRNMYSAKEGVGGALLDYIHELNYSRWFFGKPIRVSGMLGSDSSLDIETEDTASLLLRFDTDTIVQFHLDYVQRPYSRSCHIIGDNGTIKWTWDNPSVRRYNPEAENWLTELEFNTWKPNEMYLDMMEHFIQCVRTNTDPTSTIADGWRDLQLALAAKESHRTNSHVDL